MKPNTNRLQSLRGLFRRPNDRAEDRNRTAGAGADAAVIHIPPATSIAQGPGPLPVAPASSQLALQPGLRKPIDNLSDWFRPLLMTFLSGYDKARLFARASGGYQDILMRDLSYIGALAVHHPPAEAIGTLEQLTVLARLQDEWQQAWREHDAFAGKCLKLIATCGVSADKLNSWIGEDTELDDLLTFAREGGLLDGHGYKEVERLTFKLQLLDHPWKRSEGSSLSRGGLIQRAVIDACSGNLKRMEFLALRAKRMERIHRVLKLCKETSTEDPQLKKQLKERFTKEKLQSLRELGRNLSLGFLESEYSLIEQRKTIESRIDKYEEHFFKKGRIRAAEPYFDEMFRDEINKARAWKAQYRWGTGDFTDQDLADIGAAWHRAQLPAAGLKYFVNKPKRDYPQGINPYLFDVLEAKNLLLAEEDLHRRLLLQFPASRASRSFAALPEGERSFEFSYRFSETGHTHHVNWTVKGTNPVVHAHTLMNGEGRPVHIHRVAIPGVPPAVEDVGEASEVSASGAAVAPAGTSASSSPATTRQDHLFDESAFSVIPQPSVRMKAQPEEPAVSVSSSSVAGNPVSNSSLSGAARELEKTRRLIVQFLRSMGFTDVEYEPGTAYPGDNTPIPEDAESRSYGHLFRDDEARDMIRAHVRSASVQRQTAPTIRPLDEEDEPTEFKFHMPEDAQGPSPQNLPDDLD